ncbi:MAG: hypothetical protein ACIAQ0_13510, partial [Phycisphaerales bacterium JB058]
MAITKSFDSSARASATSITFQQLNLETSPATRPEVIAVLAQVDDITVSDLNVPVLADGTQQQAFDLYGVSPMYQAATKLFPESGDGAKCPVYFVPIANGESSSLAEVTIASSTATKSMTAYVNVREPYIGSAADAVGKIATNALNDPAKAPRGTKLDWFNTLSIPFTITKDDDETAIAAAAAAAVNAETYSPVVGGSVLGVLTLTSAWSGSSNGMLGDVTLTDEDGVSLSGQYGIGTITVSNTEEADDADISDALDNLTESYGITRVVNQFDSTANLDALQAWGDGMR